MKFYDNKDKIISNYEKYYNNIIVKYINGEERIFSISEKNNIEQEMIKQARNRDEELFEKVYWEKKKYILQFAASFIPLTMSAKIQFALVFYIAFIYATVKLYQIVKTHKKLEELKKYRLFLGMQSELEKEKNSDITKIIEIDPYERKEININTLDDFSYNDVKIIKKELKRRNKIKEN